MRGDRSQRALFHQVRDDPSRRHLPLVRVRPLQYLIEQVEEPAALLPPGCIHHLLQPFELGHEVRRALRQRVLHAHARPQSHRRGVELGCAHRTARAREHEVRSDGAKQRALARHVRAGYEQERTFRSHLDIVMHPRCAGD